jgi:hypothetical protein
MSGRFMDSTRFKLAILNVLANCPGGRATRDDVRREVEILIASEDQIEPLNDLSALADVDIFQSGLVLQNDAGLQITTAGLSLLHSLESSSGVSPEISTSQALPEFKLIDDLIGTEDRLRIFDLGLRARDHNTRDGNRNPAMPEKGQTAEIVPGNATSETGTVDLREETDLRIPDGVDNANHDLSPPVEEDRTDAIDAPDRPSHAPAFSRRGFGAKVREPERNALRPTGLLALIATKKNFITGLWRPQLAQRASNPRTEAPVGKTGNAAFALLGLFVVVACVGAAIALGQIKSLKADIAMLQRELLPLRERLGKLEQIEKKKREADQQEEAQSKADTNRPAGGTDQTALNLSREEVQLIREYIKPAPATATPAPAINVGETVGIATIPLPSQLMEKIPKLLGGRFTTRNGSIIILRRDSRQADVVLPPN